MLSYDDEGYGRYILRALFANFFIHTMRTEEEALVFYDLILKSISILSSHKGHLSLMD